MTSTALQTQPKSVTLSHGQTRYFEAGSGHPTILLHASQYTSGGQEWLYNLSGLSSKLHVYAPDLVGWGPGGKLEQEYSFAYLVDFVREFQDALGIERSHIVGQSMGGWIAGLFAYESPNRVDKLVLVCSGGLTTDAHGMADRAAPDREQIRKQLQSWYRIEGLDFDSMADEAFSEMQGSGVLDSMPKIMRHMANPETRVRYQLLRRLERIQAPTLVLCGVKDNSAQRWQEVTALIPNGRYVSVDDAGHHLSTERPEEFNRNVLEFLA
jgi:pimeloyl-ACP methyl ester carboxylesterase